jgi:Flp pilus assembly protein TadB
MFFGLVLAGVAIRRTVQQLISSVHRAVTQHHRYDLARSGFNKRFAFGRRTQPVRLHQPISELARLTRDGLLLGQAIPVIAATADPPIGPWLRSIIDDAQLIGLEEALRQAATSAGTSAGPSAGTSAATSLADLARIAWVLALANATGGPPTEALETLADTLRADEAVRRESLALTAQARLSAAVLAVVPVGFCALLVATDPQARAFLLTTTAGRVCGIVGLLLDGFAFLWVRTLAGLSGPRGRVT